MVLRFIFIFCFLLFSASALNAQSYKESFYTLYSNKDTTGQRELLEKWHQNDPNDSELFVAYFNYYVGLSREEVIVMGTDVSSEESLELKGKDSTGQEINASIYSQTQFNESLLFKGIEFIDQGIEKYPNRLDMRFGKIYMLGQIEHYEEFTSEIIETINYSTVNENQWTWDGNRAVENPKGFLLTSIQDYQAQLYETNDDALLNNMEQIALAILKLYPDHVESQTNLSVVYLLQKKYEKALVPLKQAEKIDPKDYVVLGNIAHAYKMLGDKDNAIKYYKLTQKYGDKESKAYAKSQIKELKKA